jgi:hypothetical protein
MPRAFQPIRAGAVALVLLFAGSQAWAAGGHGHGGGRGGGSHAGRAGSGGHVGTAAARTGHGGRLAPGPGWHGGAGGAPHAVRDGHWFHGVRGGQFGWWWVSAAPAYLALQPGYAVTNIYAPGAMAVEPVYGYFCNPLQRYYPEVQSCPEPWTIVVPAPE